MSVLQEFNSPIPSDDQVRLVEVGPRDGLQNESECLDVPTKIALIEALVDAGLRVVEVGSFVSPKWVPQMANSDAVFSGLRQRADTVFPVLVPNLEGLEKALRLGVREISCFTAASDAFNQHNIHCDIGESLARIRLVAEAALAAGLRVRAYVSCVMGCPYQGAVPLKDVVRVVESLRALGCYQVSLGDTIGVGTAGQLRALLHTLFQSCAAEHLALHLHDTYGQALANIYAGLHMGIRTFDSSVAGLGGCPYARGASGNVATEDLVYLLNGLGLQSGVDLEKLVQVGDNISRRLQRDNGSKVAKALLARR